jgi:glycosyltransferase involved in cell wall biosynthesis
MFFPGFLVTEHNVDAMAHCCQLLLLDEDLLISMRQKARQRVEEKFTVGQQVASLRAIMGLSDARV